MSNKRLGKGLEALIRPHDESESPGIININIHDVQPNPHQPRKQFNKESLAERCYYTYYCITERK